MAGIYTDNYKEYRDFKEWADKQVITFFDGHKERVGDWVYSHEASDFDWGKLSIANTSTWLDIYLIQNCKMKFVVERMMDAYGSDFDKYRKQVNLTDIPEGYDKKRKIVILNPKKCKFPFKKRMFSRPIGRKVYWALQSNDNFWYNRETKVWVDQDYCYPKYANTAHIVSTKALIRHLRKQYLPKGITFTLQGNYIGEDYLIKIK